MSGQSNTLFYFTQNSRLGCASLSSGNFASAKRIARIVSILNDRLFDRIVVFNFLKTDSKDNDVTMISEGNVRYINFHSSRMSVLATVRYLVVILRLLIRIGGPKAIISYNYYLTCFIPSLVLKLLYPTCIYIMQLEDGVDHNDGYSSFQKVLYGLFIRVQRSVSYAAFVPNPRLMRYLKGVRTFLITGIPESLKMPEPRNKDDVMEILFCGTLDERRGIVFYLQQIIDGTLGQFIHHICGVPTDQEQFESLLNQAKRSAEVIYHSRLDNQDYQALIGKIDVLLNLADPDAKLSSETFPSKLLDGLETGKIIVSFSLPGLEEFRHPLLRICNKDTLVQTLNDLRDAISDEVKATKATYSPDDVDGFCEYMKIGLQHADRE